MSAGTALIKRRERYLKLIKTFPEREQFYLGEIGVIDEAFDTLAVCRRCGRPLTDSIAVERGYGKECMARTNAEAEEL